MLFLASNEFIFCLKYRPPKKKKKSTLILHQIMCYNYCLMFTHPVFCQQSSTSSSPRMFFTRWERTGRGISPNHPASWVLSSFAHATGFQWGLRRGARGRSSILCLLNHFDNFQDEDSASAVRNEFILRFGWRYLRRAHDRKS